MSSVGLQLWTIREELERDLEGALRRVGELGYDGVELFQLHGRTATDLLALLDDAGLKVAGRHAGLEALENELPKLAAEMEVFGTDRVAISWIDPDALDADRVRKVAASAQAAGIRLGFHNHWTEPAPIDGGPSFLDQLRAFAPDLLWLELDLGWVWQAGVDPVDELAKTSGRCPLVHLKDYVSRDGRDDVPVGDGVVGYDRVIPEAAAAGAEWLIVEEDEVGPDPFGAIERSLRYVQGVA